MNSWKVSNRTLLLSLMLPLLAPFPTLAAPAETQLDVSVDMLSGPLDFLASQGPFSFGSPIPYGVANNLVDRGWIWIDGSLLTVEFPQPVALTRIRVYCVYNQQERGAQWVVEHSADNSSWVHAADFPYEERLGAGVDDTGVPMSGTGGWYSISFNEDSISDPFWRIRQVEVIDMHAPRSAEMEFYGLVEPLPNTAPLLRHQATDQSVAAGHSVTLEVRAWGTPPLSYQWQRNGVALNDGGRISGATTNRLQIDDVRVEDVGLYKVIVSNAYGSTNSLPAGVSVVLQAPEITAQPADQSVFTGSDVSLSVTADGSLPMTYQWRRNGVDLSDGEAVSGANSTNLTITAVSIDNAGFYSVVVSNVFGFMTSLPTELNVTVGPPIITEQPRSQTVPLLSTTSLQIQATGSLPLTYQWQFNGAELIDGVDRSGTHSPTLRITNVSLTDLGRYSVVVSNELGWVQSVTVDLATSGAVLFTARQTAQTATIWWNDAGRGMVLQRASSLTSPQWQDVPGSEGTNRVTLQTTNGQAFFRLFSPVTVLLSEDFQSGFIDDKKWTGFPGLISSAVVVPDPLDNTGLNQVLTFTKLAGGGDLLSRNPVVTAPGTFLIKFDYLGLPQNGSGSNGLGGFVGVFQPGNELQELWIAMVAGEGGYQPLEGGALIEDGQWHSYEVIIDTQGVIWNGPFGIKFEDWNGAGGVAGDAYFDNITVTSLP
jgi:hypothetical protein